MTQNIPFQPCFTHPVKCTKNETRHTHFAVCCWCSDASGGEEGELGEDEGAAEEVWAGGEAGEVPSGAVEDGEIQAAPAAKPKKKTGDYYYTCLPLLMFDTLTTCSFVKFSDWWAFYLASLDNRLYKHLRKSLKTVIKIFRLKSEVLSLKS